MLTRRQAKWVCTAGCIATVVILIASIWCDAGFNFHRFGCGVGSGQIGGWWWEYCDYDYDKETFLNLETHPPRLVFSLPSVEKTNEIYSLAVDGRSTGQRWMITLPLWLVLLLLAFPTAFLWWRDRTRIRVGCCRKCGYDLTGNVSGTCPECGTEIKPIVS